jgi:hypothetical protein
MEDVSRTTHTHCRNVTTNMFPKDHCHSKYILLGDIVTVNISQETLSEQYTSMGNTVIGSTSYTAGVPEACH